MNSNLSISEAQRRRVIHGAVLELAAIDPDSKAYEIKLAELESHLTQAADRKPRVKRQPPVEQTRPAGPGTGAAFWRARWTAQKGRIAQAGEDVLPISHLIKQ